MSRPGAGTKAGVAAMLQIMVGKANQFKVRLTVMAALADKACAAQ